jgi:hypothetical protein
VTSTVEFDSQRETWRFAEEVRLWDGATSLVIKRVDLALAKATDLARALRRARQVGQEPEFVFIDLAPDDEYSPKESVVDRVAFFLGTDGKLSIKVGFTDDIYTDNDHDLYGTVGHSVERFLSRQKSRLISLRADDYRSTAPYFHEVTFSTPTRSKTLLDLYQIADDLATLIEAARSGSVTPETALGLLRGGRADLLIGLPEDSWLDVKSQHFDLGSPRGTISIAEAISCFCNAEEGGILVIGMDTKRVPGGEVIKSVKPVPLDGATVRRYRQAIENRLFPLPNGLTIEPIKIGLADGLMVISVPPQDEELKPFLVHGTIVDGKVYGAFIGIVRRSGQDSVPITAQQIHSTMAAGRALLRRGQAADGRR